MRWEVPREWEGERCYIIGGGPSIARLKTELLQNENLIVINNAYKLFPNASFCFFHDEQWFKQHERKLLETFRGRIVTHHNKFEKADKVLYLQRGSNHRLARNPKTLNHGNNSGHGALNLAVHLGASPIYLLGYDMRVVQNRHNYHKAHTREMKHDIYKKYIEAMGSIELPEGVTVYNATPDSALPTFPFAKTEIARLHEPA